MFLSSLKSFLSSFPALELDHVLTAIGDHISKQQAVWNHKRNVDVFAPVGTCAGVGGVAVDQAGGEVGGCGAVGDPVGGAGGDAVSADDGDGAAAAAAAGGGGGGPNCGSTLKHAVVFSCS